MFPFITHDMNIEHPELSVASWDIVLDQDIL